MSSLRILAALPVLLLSACADHGALLQDKLDPVTAVTITYCQTPFVFYRDDTGKAAFARDYVHVAPLEVNRTGDFRYYIWLGIWDTLQDTDAGNASGSFESIVIFADGEPLSLDLSGWLPAAIGASEPVYIKPVSSATDAYYEVTIDQLRLIAEASDLRLQSTGPKQQSYELWDQQTSARASLNKFLGKSVY